MSDLHTTIDRATQIPRNVAGTYDRGGALAAGPKSRLPPPGGAVGPRARMAHARRRIARRTGART